MTTEDTLIIRVGFKTPAAPHIEEWEVTRATAAQILKDFQASHNSNTGVRAGTYEGTFITIDGTPAERRGVIALRFADVLFIG